MNAALFLITWITAVMYVVALAMIFFIRKDWDDANIHGKVTLMLSWFGHATLYWSTITVARTFFGYVGPSFFTSLWGAIVYMQAPLTVIFVLAPIIRIKWNARRGNVN